MRNTKENKNMQNKKYKVTRKVCQSLRCDHEMAVSETPVNQPGTTF
jgi:hypothetical protein